MRFNPMKYFFFFLVSLLWFEPTIPAMAAFPIQPFEAHYTVYSKGIPLGEAVMKLDNEGNDRYRISFDVSPNDLVGLVYSAHVKEHASGEFYNGTVRPLRYEQLRKKGDDARTTQINFNWNKDVLHGESNGKQVSLALSPRVVDPVSLYLQVMLDLRQGHTYDQYTFIDTTELKTYRVKHEGEEMLKTPLGNLRTVRISQSKPNSSRVTTLWFAPDLDYLPVQIAQENKGKEVLRMVIQHVQGIRRK